MNYTHPHIVEARTMLKAIGFPEPFYLVDVNQPAANQVAYSAAETAYAPGDEYTIAQTSPVVDLAHRTGMLRHEYAGRGFCCRYWQAVAERTLSQVLGTTIHEAGHHVDYADRPERDEPDYCRAMAMFYPKQCEVSASRGERWLRACTHLWQRACAAGYDISFGAVVNLDQYHLSRSQFASALAESNQWRHLSIRQLEQKLTASPLAIADPPKRRISVLLINGRLHVAA